jgi:hypothetical protein
VAAVAVAVAPIAAAAPVAVAAPAASNPQVKMMMNQLAMQQQVRVHRGCCAVNDFAKHVL